MKRSGGFTLIELMITLALVAILATIAVPGFWNLIQNNRMTTQTNELVSAMNLARSEAIKRGASVTVRSTGGDFADGWCVHLGADCTGTNPIRMYPAMNRVVVDADEAVIVFDNRGARLAPPAGDDMTITLEPEGCATGASNRARQIDIGNTGRVSVERMDC